MNSTDFLNLSGHKIIENVKNSLPINITKALNVLTVKDNVLFIWDFQSQCVLTLNIRAARQNCQNEGVICQKLLPLSSAIFSPEKIVANDSGTLLVVAGPNGVLVFKLPARCPPYGAFSNNKELVYCQTFNLDERLLTCSDSVEVLQVRFHPGSMKDNHILILTSDNTLRLYQIEEEAINLGVFLVGNKPMAKMPCSKMTFLGALGETAVDFDFGHPEINNKNLPDQNVNNKETSINKAESPKKPLVKVENPFDQAETFVTVVHPEKYENEDNQPWQQENWSNFSWPVYVLAGDFIVNIINIPLYEKIECTVKGPLPLMPTNIIQCDKRACSIICLNSSPQVVCIGSTNGEILHGVVLPINDDDAEEDRKKPLTPSPSENIADREICIFEAVNIELGLTTTLPQEDEGYSYPIFLHKDDSRCDRYSISHAAGVHCVSIGCIEDLQDKSMNNSNDVFSIPSTVDYLVCTKTTSTKHYNPVIGFSDYYNPNSIIALLANGNFVTLALINASILPKMEKLNLEVEDVLTSPIKEMLKVPFEQHIQNLLKKADSHPIMKLSKNDDHSLKECHELIQKTAQIFKEKFKYHIKAKEEIEKRATALNMLKDYQLKELENMSNNKRDLQEKAECLAEKYEDIHEKQEELLKRCAKLLMVLSMKQEILSDAELEYLKDLKNMREKLDKCDTSIEKLLSKKNYQESQMRNWKSQHQRKTYNISETHKNTIKDSLVDSSTKINKMVEEIRAIKKQLRLK